MKQFISLLIILTVSLTAQAESSSGQNFLVIKANDGDTLASVILGKIIMEKARASTHISPWRVFSSGDHKDEYYNAYLDLKEDSTFLGTYLDAFHFLRQGGTMGTNYLSELFSSDVFSDEEYVEIVSWCNSNVNRDDGYSMNLLGAIYYNGFGVSVDYTEAFYWFEFGAELGNFSSMCWLGTMYHNGHGVSKDDVEAHKWMILSSEGGHSGALGYLVDAYTNGWGVSIDDSIANEWHIKSAQVGVITSRAYCDLNNISWK